MLLRIQFGLGLLVVTSLGCRVQDDDWNRAVALVKPAMIKSHVRFLSTDLLRGRNTGEEGFAIARDYVASQFERIGLAPANGDSYLQPFDVLVSQADLGSRLVSGNRTIATPDATFAPDWQGQQPTLKGDGVFVGYGLSGLGRDDYAGADVKGKIVFLIPSGPPDWLEDGTKARVMRTKLESAHHRGALAVVMLQVGRAATTADAWRRQSARPATPMALEDGSAASFRPDVNIGPEAAPQLLRSWGFDAARLEADADRGFPARSVGSITVTRRHRMGRTKSWNVVGLVPGRDSALKSGTVVYTAHLDHVGIGEADERGDSIFNGTHDNAMGIGKLLATAEMMVRLRPRRSVLFMAMGAEERGLLGSWYYVRHPLRPLEQTAANINHDGGLEGAATDDVFAFGSDLSTLEETLDRTAAASGMTINRKFPAPFSASQALLFRSDQYSFLMAGVPGIYLMDGFTIAGDPERGRLQWDDYLKNYNHKQRDNFDERWVFESPVRMAVFSLRLGYDLANRDDLPQMLDGSPMRRPRGSPVGPFYRTAEVAATK